MPSNGDVRIQTRVWNGASYTYTDVSTDPLWDWDVSITGGRSSLYAMPTASVCRLRATLSSNALDTGSIDVGDQIQVQVYTETAATYNPLWTGQVSEIVYSYESWGVVNPLISMEVTAVGPFAVLQNQTWYNTSATATTTQNLVTRIKDAANSQSWYEVDPALAWNGVSPSRTWATWNKSTQQLFGAFNVVASGTWQATLPVGQRQVWSDLELLLVGSHGWITEFGNGDVTAYIGQAATVYDISTVLLEPSLTSMKSRTELRNSVEVTYSGGLVDDSDQISVYTYGQQTGSLDTALTNPTDALTIAGYIVGGYASPTMKLTSFSVELLASSNPGTYLDNWTSGATQSIYIGKGVKLPTLPAPFPNLTPNNYIINGYQWNLRKGSVHVTCEVEPQATWNSSPTWQTIGAAYTWTSYGAAFPTTKWSDL